MLSGALHFLGFFALSGKFFSHMVVCLFVQDMNQEVKEASLDAISLLIARFGGNKQVKIPWE